MKSRRRLRVPTAALMVDSFYLIDFLSVPAELERQPCALHVASENRNTSFCGLLWVFQKSCVRNDRGGGGEMLDAQGTHFNPKVALPFD